jgi:hypothetical protein
MFSLSGSGSIPTARPRRDHHRRGRQQAGKLAGELANSSAAGDFSLKGLFPFQSAAVVVAAGAKEGVLPCGILHVVKPPLPEGWVPPPLCRAPAGLGRVTPRSRNGYEQNSRTTTSDAKMTWGGTDLFSRWLSTSNAVCWGRLPVRPVSWVTVVTSSQPV